MADELRDADPQSCPVCDALPHRQNHPTVSRREQKMPVSQMQRSYRNHWFYQLLPRIKFSFHNSHRPA